MKIHFYFRLTFFQGEVFWSIYLVCSFFITKNHTTIRIVFLSKLIASILNETKLIKALFCFTLEPKSGSPGKPPPLTEKLKFFSRMREKKEKRTFLI